MKKPGAPQLVNIAILTTITIVFWVFFSLYRVFTAKPAPSIDPKLLDPIVPSLDIQTLDKIRDKIYLSKEEANTPIISPAQINISEIFNQPNVATKSSSTQ